MIFDAVSQHQNRLLSLRTFHEHIAHNTIYKTPAAPLEIKREGNMLLSTMNKFPTIQEAVSILIAEAMQQAEHNQAIARPHAGDFAPGPE